MIALSRWQVAPILAAKKQGRNAATTSLDLNRTQSEVRLEAEGVVFPDGPRLSWQEIEEIEQGEGACFAVTGDGIEKIQFFSPARNRFYSLLSTELAPTMLLSGFPMHRIKGIDPQEDTQRKIRTIAPVIGRVLDVCTGLGYTALAAAETAAHVTTIELDSTVLEVARRNPWSQALFENPRITQVVGDASERIQEFEDAAFARLFHDPPTFRLAGELYSGAFYRQLFRVLARGGRLFHYIGDLESASGSSVAKGAMRRLQEAGFTQVLRRPEAFGLVATR